MKANQFNKNFLIIILLVIISQTGRAASLANCGAEAVNKPSVDAAPILKACLTQKVAQGADTIELPAGRYFISSTLDLEALSNVTIRTQNLSGGTACLDAGASACAVLIATPTFNDSILLSRGANKLVLKYIALDGNIGPRRAHFDNKTWGPNGAYNARIHNCTDCQFIGFASVRAPHGTGLEFEGDRALFDTVNFSSNGWGLSGYANDGWADGLTIHSSAGVVIKNSKFLNNSDVNLILGNGPGAIIQNNLVGGTHNFSFAGLMLDNFNSTKPGDFSGAVVSNNRIECGEGYCGLGLMVGPHFWYKSAPLVGTGARIENNFISGAKQGIYVSGANGFVITANTISTPGAFGGPQYAKCTAQPLSVAAGDGVSAVHNNYDLFADLISGCAPQDLPGLVVHMTGVSYDVAYLYKTVLGRIPDAGSGIAYTNSGMSLFTMRVNMALSEEAKSKINEAYLRVLGRPADVNGINNFMMALAKGSMTMDQLPIILMQSQEALNDPYRYY